MLSQNFVRTVALGTFIAMGCATPPTATATPDAAAAAVWSSESAGFTLRVSGGFPSPPLMATCAGNDHTYTYDVASGVLRHVGCEVRQRVNSAVTLDAASRTLLAAQLAALRTTTALACGADFNDLVLTVTRGAGVSQTYNSTYFAGCPGSTRAAPFIAGDALNTLAAGLRYAINTCADGDAGLRCTVLDAGVADGG